MNMPLTAVAKTRPHPMLIIAGAAVALVCLTGTAAIIGWLPNSNGAGVHGETSTLAQTALPGVAAQQSVTAAAAPRAAVAPTVHRQAYAAPAHRAPALVCQNCGVVESIRDITTRGNGSGLGAAGGAVVGGLLGNQVGGGHGKEAMTVVGAIGGAFAGNQIEKQAKATHSYEITVHMNNGTSRTVAQDTQPEWRDGDHVRIVNGVLHTNA